MAWYHRFTWHIEPISDMATLEQRVASLGFLPMFRSGIKGYSVYEATPQFWPDGDDDGPWEWKGPILREGQCAYGKFFNRKAVWISREWLPHYINYRRTKHLAPTDDLAALDEIVLQTVQGEGRVTSKELAALLGLSGRPRRRSAADLVADADAPVKVNLDPILARLMMEGRIVIADFLYNIDRRGNRYGWGIAQYATPEDLYGNLACGCTPAESYGKMLAHLKRAVPVATDKQLAKLLG